MALKPVSYKIDEKKLEAIKAVCEAAELTQAEFINLAIDNLIEKISVEQSGGMVMCIPTPYIYQELTEDQREQLLDLLNHSAYEFTNIAKGKLDLGLDLIKHFAVERLNPDNAARDKASFLDAFYKYLEIKDRMKGDETE